MAGVLSPSPAAGSTVMFGGYDAAPVTFVDAATLTVVAPAGYPAAVPVVVTTPEGESSNAYDGYTWELPALTSISPAEGAVDGGTTVTVNGSYFVNGSSVSFGGAPAASVTFVSDTQLTAVTSTAYASGLSDVVVTTPYGYPSAAFSGFDYKLPAITAVTPAAGSVDGGETLTITGTDFVPGVSILFNGIDAASTTYVDASTLYVVAPPGAAGLSSLTVTTPLGGYTSDPYAGYTYEIPGVTAVSPSGGTVDGGTVVTITGTRFAPGSSVSFAWVEAASVTVVNDTTLTAVTPPGSAGTADIVVTTPLGNATAPFTGFTYNLPGIIAVTPAQGSMSGGDAITISGSGFVPGMSVSLGGIPATDVVFVNATTLTAVTPGSTFNGTVDVAATTPGGNASAPFNGYTYLLPAPQIEMLDQTYGIETGGTAVTIIGANFQAGATVRFGGAAATSVAVENATTLTAMTPAHAQGIVDVTVTNSDNQAVTLANAYTYTGLPPVITAVDPAFGPTTGGTAITVTGSGFTTGAVVTLGGVAATSINVVNATTITAVTAPHAGGTVAAMVTNPNGAPGRLSLAYSYQMVCTGYTPPAETDPAIVITSPVANAALLGDRVNVTGTYSGPAGTGITVNGVAAITDGYYFYANNIPVAGAMNIDARAATPYGKSATSSVPVTASGSAMIELKASIDQGAAPLAATFSYAFLGTPQTIAIDYNGDGVDDFTTSNASAPLTYSYSVPGIYKPRLTITDTVGTTYIADTVIDVKTATADAAPFQQSYARMHMALLCGDLDGALAHFTDGAKERYRPVFQALAPYMTEILNSWSPLQESEITAQYAEFAVNRLINGVNRIFFIYFLKDQDGVWRLDTM